MHRGCAFLKNHDDRPEAAKVRRWLDNMARDGKIVKTKHANPESYTRNANCFIGTPAFDEIPSQIPTAFSRRIHATSGSPVGFTVEASGSAKSK